MAGAIDALDRKSAVALLSHQGRFVTELLDAGQPQEHRSLGEDLPASARSFLGRRRVRSKDLVSMTNQFSTALRAGLPLMNCLELLRDQQKKPVMRDLLDDLVQSVHGGLSLSEAMAEHKEVFSPLYLSMVRVGETGGILEETTTQLAEILKREDKVVTNMKNASAYPMFVLVLGLVSVTVIVTWILPGIMATMDMDPALMPLPTRMLLTMSDVVKAMFTTLFGGLATVALVIATVQLIRWIRTEGRLQWDAFRIRIPVLGTVLKTIAVGRFARTLGALTAGGVTILDALAVVRDTLGNEVLAREIDAVAEEVKRGESLAAPLDRSGSFPPLLVQIVAVGEQTGKLDELLLSAADTFDDEADAAINRFMSIFPALLILLLALVVAFIVVATLLPMVSMDLGGLG